MKQVVLCLSSRVPDQESGCIDRFDSRALDRSENHNVIPVKQGFPGADFSIGALCGRDCVVLPSRTALLNSGDDGL